MNAVGQPIKKIKGPKPRGLTKFKPVAAQEQKIEEEEMSENQKRKREQQRLKKEAEEKARREEEERQRQEKLRLQREREERETEERRLKTEALFRGLAAANEKKQEHTTTKASSFESIMNEQA